MNEKMKKYKDIITSANIIYSSMIYSKTKRIIDKNRNKL